MARMLFEDEPCQPDNFRCNRVCPRISKAEFGRRFFSGDLRWRFDGRAKWITQLARMFPVGVVNAPELAARLRSHGCAHAWQFTRNRLCEDVSATQNARTVRGMSSRKAIKNPCIAVESRALSPKNISPRMSKRGKSARHGCRAVKIFTTRKQTKQTLQSNRSP